MRDDYTQLVKRCRKHDEKAMRELYDEMAPMAMGVCMRYCRSHEEAQDLFQEGFLKVFEHIDSLREPRSVGAWIYHIMVNVCVEYHRSRKEMRNVELAEHETVTLPLDPFGMEEIVKALQQLPPQQQTVFNLVEVEGYSYEEVSERLSITVSSARSTLCRAKAMLRERLKGNG